MQPEDECVEVTVVSHTDLSTESKTSPVWVAEVLLTLLSLGALVVHGRDGQGHGQGGDGHDDDEEGRDSAEGSHEPTVLFVADHPDTAGILTIGRVKEGLLDKDLPAIRFTEDEMEGVVEFRNWIKSEATNIAKFKNDPVTLLQRVASDKVSYIVATKSHSEISNALLTNGQVSKIVSKQISQVVPWGCHIFVRTDDKLTIYDENLEVKYRLTEGSDVDLRIVTQKEMLAYLHQDWEASEHESDVVVIGRNFAWPKPTHSNHTENTLAGEGSEESEDKDDYAEKPIIGDKIMPPYSEFWKEGEENPFLKESSILGICICPFTNELVFVNWDETQETHYIQRGQKTTRLPCEFDSQQNFESPASSYSNKWYLTCYPQEESEQRTIYIVDQKTLELKGYYFWESPDFNYSLHFLKPQKQVYPFMINTSNHFFLFCEFRDTIYPVAESKWPTEMKHVVKWPTSLKTVHKLCVTHLSGRVWICLETFKDPLVLVVDTDKLYKLLHIT